ncbi:MAG TPA: HlyD family efflux transporter periplasmic adaptor subunit [Gemmatimonadaceae bacterium]|nr:HlyD family efflux transporter periplasmic adaptor subunit [Gemmatimonadaceae bacterium]
MSELLAGAMVEDCIEAHLARHAPTGRALYLTILALTIVAGAAMVVVQVPVSVQATGVIRPIVERQEARAAESGIVQAMYVGDGDRVRAGDTLLTLDSRAVAVRLAASDAITATYRNELADLTALLAVENAPLPWARVSSSHRRQQAREYTTILAELDARAAFERRETDRLRVLLARGFVAPEQLESQAGAQRAAEAAAREHVERMRSTWSDAHVRVTNELQRLVAERVEITEALARHVVIAPVDGTLEMSASLSSGSVLQQGERVATISPNTDLIGEALLPARNIALVQRGTPARLMIDALNYREWGVVHATVLEVADDASFTGEQPVFRVRCGLARNELRLRGGQRASLGKGMTFRARFVIAERSLVQLLFDGIDDWLNPARAQRTAAAPS